MRVLGIDPGTAIVGFGIIDYKDKKFDLIDYGCIYTDKDMEMPKRIMKIYEDLDILIKKYKPDFVAIEELFYFKNNKTVISVSQARGVMLLCAQQHEIPISEYTPLQVKIGITGYGRAEKKQVQIMVQKLLNLREIPKPDDAADAIAIAITHINSSTSLLANVRNKKIDTKNVKTDKLTAKEYRELFNK